MAEDSDEVAEKVRQQQNPVYPPGEGSDEDASTVGSDPGEAYQRAVEAGEVEPPDRERELPPADPVTRFPPD